MKTINYPSGHTVTNNYDNAGRTNSFVGNLGDGGTQRNYATGISYSPLGGLSQEQLGTTTPIYNKLFYNSRGQLAEIREGKTLNDTSWQRGAIINFYDTCWGMCFGNSMPNNNGSLKTQQVFIPQSDTVDYDQHYDMFSQSYEYDSLNRLHSVHEGSWQQQYSYDRFGNRTIDQANTFGAGIPKPNFTVNTANNRLGVASGQSGTMSYDNAGNLTTDTYSGAAVLRGYDAENRMTSETQANNIVAGSYSYDGNGQRVRRNINNVETWQIYGLGGELLAEYVANASALSPQKEYGYRNGQLLITATVTAGGWGTPPVLHDNPLLVGQTTVQARHITELRDAINALRTHMGLPAFSWQQPPAVGVGDLIKADPILEMRAALDQALGPPSPAYSLGLAQGQPIKAIHIQELRNRVLAAWNGGSGGADIRWLVSDQLGTPRMIFDQSGSLTGVSRHDYLPFGEELGLIGGRTPTQGYGAADGARQKFTQKERDDETKLDYFLARYYSSTQGRFTSPDEFIGGPHEVLADDLAPTPLLYAEPTEPQSLNKYTYSLGNPLRYVDPDGHQTKQADGLIIQPVSPATTVNILIGTGKALDNMLRGINNLEADFGMGNQRVPLHRASNMTQGMTMVVVEDLTVFGGLLSGKPQAGVMVADSEESAAIAAEVGNASRAKTTAQMAGELSDEIGKNSVSYSTPNKVGHIDLRGKSHFDKPTGQPIPTPHVQERVLNRSPGGGRVNTGPQTTRPATKQDIRTARKIVERRENQ